MSMFHLGVWCGKEKKKSPRVSLENSRSICVSVVNLGPFCHSRSLLAQLAVECIVLASIHKKIFTGLCELHTQEDLLLSSKSVLALFVSCLLLAMILACVVY